MKQRMINAEIKKDRPERWKRVYEQDPFCHYCRIKFEDKDMILRIRRRNGHAYHKVCAELLHII
jgi:hypothetical protein